MTARLIPHGRGEMHPLPLHFSPITELELAALVRVPGRLSLDDEVFSAGHYHAQLFNQGAARRDIQLSEELMTRLEQMNFLLKSVAVLVAEYYRRSEAEPMQEDPRGQLWFMMFLYAEAFYYFAHRVQDVLEKKGLPHITGFKRSLMITIIRNHLIEHPFGHYKDFGGSHGALSRRDGPIILVKGQGVPPKKLQPHQDPGLFRNARELRGLLHPVLARGLETLGGRVEKQV